MRRGLLIAAAATGAAAAAAPVAAAAPLQGSVTLALPRGVTAAVTAPAARAGRVVTLPVTGGDLATGEVRTGGTVRLSAQRRSVLLRSLTVKLGARSRVSALLNGRRTTVLALTPLAIRRDATSLGLGATKATSKLNRHFPRRFGTVRLTARLPPPPGRCPLSTAPTTLTRPQGALDVTSATITWHVRDSFIRYMASGEGATPRAGATGDAPEGDPPLTYSFHFPFAAGWCDPATGAARLTFTGAVAFSYRDHGIDVTVANPEVELNGPSSRVVFAVNGQRAVLETLDPSRSTAGATAKTLVYQAIPGAIPPGAATSVFAGYYLPGDPFGWVSISFTTA